MKSLVKSIALLSENNKYIVRIVTKSDKIMEYITTNNKDNGILFKKQRIQLHWCTTLDGKYYVSYYNPEFEVNK